MRFANDRQWQEVFEQYAGGVGATNLFEKQHQLGGTPLKSTDSERVAQEFVAGSCLFPEKTSERPG